MYLHTCILTAGPTDLPRVSRGKGVLRLLGRELQKAECPAGVLGAAKFQSWR